jgi:hypothetical protein
MAPHGIGKVPIFCVVLFNVEIYIKFIYTLLSQRTPTVLFMIN